MHYRFEPRFKAFVLLTTLVVMAVSFGVLRARVGREAKQLARMRDDRDALRGQVSQLADDLAFAQTDAYVERIARDEWNMLMPGEVRYVNSAH